MALSQSGIETAVLEVARGGILLKGIGVAHNDVAVVTNVSADHLDHPHARPAGGGQATITRITRPTGWDVLNADDPGSWRCAESSLPAVPVLPGPGSPPSGGVLTEEGAGPAPLDGSGSVDPGPGGGRPHPAGGRPRDPGRDLQHLHADAMAAVAAALGVGLPERTSSRGCARSSSIPNGTPAGRTSSSWTGRSWLSTTPTTSGHAGVGGDLRGLCR